MEIIWYDIRFKKPQILDKNYLVTFYGKFLTPHMQTTEMAWSCEEKRGVNHYFWKWKGVKISGSCVVTHWAEHPEPAIKEEDYDEFLYKDAY